MRRCLRVYISIRVVVSSLTPEEETTIWAILHGKIFAATIKAKNVPVILELMDRYVKEQDITEQSAMDDVVEVLEGSECGEDAIRYVTHWMLWAACRCPAGKMAEEAAREGGKSVGWEIVYKSDGGFDFGLHIHDVFVVPNDRSLPDVRDAVAVPKQALIN